MKWSRVFWVGLLCLAIVLVATNPTVEDLRLFIRQAVAEQMAQEPDWVQAAAGLAGLIGWDPVEYVIDRMMAGAHRKNYLLFSVFTVWTPDGQSTTFLGLLNRFWSLEE